MARWYQNVLTGEQIEVKTLAEDDFYQDNKANWARIVAPPAPDAEEVEEVEEVDLTKLTKPQLEQLAADNDIDLSEAKNNAERVEIIDAAYKALYPENDEG